LKKKGVALSMLKEKYNNLLPVIKRENQYAYELSNPLIESRDFPINGIKPLLEISFNNYRGESDLAMANLLTDIFEDLGIDKAHLLDILIGKENYPLKAIRWQNACTSGTGRRRYRPTSEGFTLKIRKEVLSDYLLKNDMILCYSINLRRSSIKYIAEGDMSWSNLKKIVEVVI
jgi:hypothetical protein